MLYTKLCYIQIITASYQNYIIGADVEKSDGDFLYTGFFFV